jgi:hypothetical protein
MNKHTVTNIRPQRGIIANKQGGRPVPKGAPGRAKSGFAIRNGKAVPAVKTARGEIVEQGVDGNVHTKHDTEVKFEHMRATANVTKEVLGNAYSPSVTKGHLLAGVPLTVTQNGPGSIAHAMKKRCDFPLNTSSDENIKLGHKALMAKIPEGMPVIELDRPLMDKYYEAVGPTKAARLLESLQGSEWNLSGVNAQKHVFAKMETLIKPHGAQPRIVYQGTDMYNALTGPVIFEIQKRMGQVFSRSNPLNKENIVIFAPGAGSTVLGDIIDEAVGEVIESDFKSNDATQGKWRKHEAMFYKKLGAPDWFVREFAKQDTVRVWTRVGIEGTVEGQRWSGESTTTSGNTYVGAAQIQGALATAGVKDSVNIHGGDDYLGVVNAPGKMVEVAEEIIRSVASTGMTAEVSLPVSKSSATFYQKRYPFSHAAGGRRPVPRFGRVLSKINIRANRNTKVGDREYMAGKYLSAAYEHRYVPVIRDILAETALAMSPQPFFDNNEVRKFEKMHDSADVPQAIRNTSPHSIGKMSDFTSRVYDCPFDDIVSLYKQVAQSALDHLDGWTVVGSDGKSRAREGNSRYMPKFIESECVSRLIACDIGG